MLKRISLNNNHNAIDVSEKKQTNQQTKRKTKTFQAHEKKTQRRKKTKTDLFSNVREARKV